MKHILYVPQEAKSYSDIVDLKIVVDGLTRWCIGRGVGPAEYRAEKSKEFGSVWFCARCRRQMSSRLMDIHHYKPVWAIVLESVLDDPPRSVKEYAKLCIVARSGVLRINVTYNDSTYDAYCKPCHARTERGTTSLWVAHFEENYPVVFKETALWKSWQHDRAMGIILRNGGDPRPPVKVKKRKQWK